ncbi:hypothetical protein Ddye_021883 [Dipteronia dyeriana]|uniref:Uncharacterized protein n=1 Tax=Dipteronia dyeriana TaxID=168575 RepID=A0AAD9U373_9ROSI|nr:hypothetical protein Ddye_021883 [Dipteronia dyeriana]
MATSSTARLSFRLAMTVIVILVLFYVGRPLYWKISATVHEIRQNKQTVKQGISQIVYEAQKSVGWWHDESDSGDDQRLKKRGGHFQSEELWHVIVVTTHASLVESFV